MQVETELMSKRLEWREKGTRLPRT